MPSCYPDCRKTAATDGEGRFSIRALSDSLRFRVLVVAKGWDPQFVDKVDPLEGPVEFRLAHRRPEAGDPQHSLRGQVLDPMSQPVVGATLEPFGYYKATGGDQYMMRFGPSPGTDPLCVTDEQGHFSLALGDTGVDWYIRVRARDLAPQLLSRQPASGTPITVWMRHGATVTGKLLVEDRPLPGVAVGLLQAERASQYSAYGRDEIATDERGVFTFSNVTPGQDYLVHGKMTTLRDFRALDTTTRSCAGRRERGGRRGSPGRARAARVGSGDDVRRGPAAAEHSVAAALDNAFDAQSLVLDASGRFDFHGVPPGDVVFAVRLSGLSIRAPEQRVHRVTWLRGVLRLGRSRATSRAWRWYWSRTGPGEAVRPTWDPPRASVAAIRLWRMNSAPNVRSAVYWLWAWQRSRMSSTDASPPRATSST